ncbi:MAG: IPT/TIG domain-containing protein [Geothrix sp.]|nr:IPT/TIG domain-containing protein [Geothrix sp.]
MTGRLLVLSALVALGCSSPMTRVSDYGATEGWPPAVNSIKPEAGHPGAQITLKGDYLGDAKQVLIGGEPATFSVVGSSLEATVPKDLGPGSVNVVVVVPRGKTAPMTFHVVP